MVVLDTRLIIEDDNAIEGQESLSFLYNTHLIY